MPPWGNSPFFYPPENLASVTKTESEKNVQARITQLQPPQKKGRQHSKQRETLPASKTAQ